MGQNYPATFKEFVVLQGGAEKPHVSVDDAKHSAMRTIDHLQVLVYRAPWACPAIEHLAARCREDSYDYLTPSLHSTTRALVFNLFVVPPPPERPAAQPNALQRLHRARHQTILRLWQMDPDAVAQMERLSRALVERQLTDDRQDPQ